jgi:hypothetical protein
MSVSAGRFRHLWMQGVLEDTRLSHAARNVLVRCGLVSTLGGEDMFSVRQETVASALGMHVNTVAGAFRRARELGWLQLVEERQRGRGWHKGDVHQLTFPAEKIPTPGGAYYEEIPTPGSGEYPHDDVGNTPKYPHAGGEIPTIASAATNGNKSLTSEHARARGDLQGIDTGLSNKQGCISRGIAPENNNHEISAIGELFADLFGQRQTTPTTLALPPPDQQPNFSVSKLKSPAIIDAETVELEPEHDIELASRGNLHAKAGRVIVIDETDREAEIARLVAAYPEDFKATA